MAGDVTAPCPQKQMSSVSTEDGMTYDDFHDLFDGLDNLNRTIPNQVAAVFLGPCESLLLTLGRGCWGLPGAGGQPCGLYAVLPSERPAVEGKLRSGDKLLYMTRLVGPTGLNSHVP